MTTYHELAHIVAGHTSPEQHGEYVAHRGVKEFVAEGSAFLVMNELELLGEAEASESRAYLQSWLRGERPPEASIRDVFKTTDTILRAGSLAITDGI